MPIYEYCCTQCGHLFEEWGQHFDSPTNEPCPACGERAERVMSQTTFKLEGSGWYVTDYGNRKGPGQEETPPTTKPDAPATTAPQTSAETKPAQTKPVDTKTADAHAEAQAKRAVPPSQEKLPSAAL